VKFQLSSAFDTTLGSAGFFRAARLFLLQHTKTGKNIPNYRKLYQMIIKYTKNGRKIDQVSKIIPTSSNIYPKWAFWFENKPSGNPVFSVKSATVFFF
jgi:hypothetical protein